MMMMKEVAIEARVLEIINAKERLVKVKEVDHLKVAPNKLIVKIIPLIKREGVGEELLMVVDLRMQMIRVGVESKRSLEKEGERK